MLTQDRQVQIRGPAKDGCIPYATSCREADLDAAIQKDVGHPLADAFQVVKEVEREALQAMTVAARLEKLLRQHWTEAGFDDWAATTEQAERLLTQRDRLRFWRECLWDAVEVVDLRSGEIRDRAINQWLLNETLAGLQRLDPPRIQTLTEQLPTQTPRVAHISGWAGSSPGGLADPTGSTLPRARRGQVLSSQCGSSMAVEHTLRNGHPQFRAATVAASQLVAEFVTDDPVAQQLAEELLTLLERTVRTSSAAETITGVLRPYLNGRRECTDLVSRQLFLNLFALWFNLHQFERGPRKGKNPYELAGIDLGTMTG